MDKTGLLRSIAETGYNVGFGAKKHFATFDLVEKGPGWIGFISMAVGIFALVFDELSAKVPSATLLVAGIVAFYMSYYRSADYEVAGTKLTRIYNDLRDLYRSVESGADLAVSAQRLKSLEDQFYPTAITKQILFSDWYAHFKFFGQHQTQWINDELQLRFWRDKVPNSLKATGLLLLACVLGYLIIYLAPLLPTLWQAPTGTASTSLK